ncbi:ring-1,2-phenylacetyl-CoA epoxidase subunit PaaE [Chitinophaga polysaccharea]|uniref:Ring-1,2-phenylacetyl-CoA epoxidase subunit PaaE n=1 Tax=Chitinophaga polysaccharea TaxID=1293035 RepID=A0A561PXL1_9BACT|nr:ferredoxin--NADP reductase [Chitinophaga polysaccharea]TWF42862.1 ring-1,2-phenylacetyl-CoA epoxidase subunit PaaE [Chitinophaga polysaccharea]
MIWQTAQVIQQTANTITIIFDTQGEPFSYKPGQFIQLTLTINGAPVTRSYSLSVVPGGHPAITVKRVPGGVMSNYILDHARQIRQWQVAGPHGTFTPTAVTYQARHVVLLAGGSGITPLYTIACSLLAEAPDTRITIIYASRSTDEIIFSKELDALQASYPQRLHVFHALSAATGVSAPGHLKGRLSKLVTRKLIQQAVTNPLDQVHYFICGPEGLMTMHQEMLTALQVAPDHIFMEWFTPGATSNDIVLPHETQEVLLHFFEQTNLLDVDAGQTILQAALDDRIPLPYSCRGGTCGICLAKLTSGQVTMRQNYALRPSDIADGMILLCQSYPLTADVTVVVGE